MSYAVFNTEAEAEAYNDAVHAILSQNELYIADMWAYVFPFEGKYYIDVHPSVPAEVVVSEIPNFNNNGEE